ncbi:hypothetical protein [Nocardioides campestrisoli]|uniref:hypothetical protein n=1 Tax=Nocardioides campestrisoli TaxID=2736757 RepID=UPI00163D5348|nr:hypothetical protein [Nocardioides campestrisoli]
MRRTPAFTTALLLGVALLAPTASSAAGPASDAAAGSAAGKTCRGLPVTIHAVDRNVQGTEGPDVVLLEYTRVRWGNVETFGGDDVLCIRADAPRDDVSITKSLQIDMGPGDDVVDSTQAPGRDLLVTLGAGSDRFEGGSARNAVSAGDWDGGESGHIDAESDVLIGGAGEDLFHSGAAGQPNGDRVDLGAGQDRLEFEGFRTAGGSVSGGRGRDTLLLEATGVQATLDNRTGRFTEDGRTTAAYDGFDDFVVHPATGSRDLTFLGTAADEHLYTYDVRVTARLGGGDDSVEIYEMTPGTVLDGGPGRDLITTTGVSYGKVDLDLRSGRFRGETAEETTYRARAARFEDASVTSYRVRLTGTDRPNLLTVSACHGSARGLGGNDKLVVKDFGRLGPSHECKGSALFGGPGNDVLQGGLRADRLIGGPGHDRVLGRRGKDTCSAEVRKRC